MGAMFSLRWPFRAPRRWWPSGWRGIALPLSILTGVLTVLLIALCAVSYCRFRLSAGYISTDRSVIFNGNCRAASQANIAIHLAINVIASAVLGSSNFFMQILVAPTRRQLNKAHASGRWLEIGVHSYRNILSMPWRNRVLWILLAISSTPLALMFNSVVIQTQASTDCLMVFAGESFLNGAHGSLPGAGGGMPMVSKAVDPEATLREISSSVSGQTSPQRWERIGLDECVDRYAQRDSVLANYRHAIMVLGYANGSSAQAGWPVAQVRRRFEDEKIENYRSVVNHIWMARPLVRTDKPVDKSTSNALSTDLTTAILMPPSTVKTVDLEMGLFTMDPTWVNEPYVLMKAEYCLSERFEIPCRVEVENTLLLVVCVMCGFKTLLCVVILIIYGGKSEPPLATTGDAIESFIVEPDSHTNVICSLSRVGLASTSKVQDRVSWGRMPMAKPWKTLRRGAGQAVPISVWVFSYTLIGCSLIVLTVLSSLATRTKGL
jgi:hypothetical protein